MNWLLPLWGSLCKYLDEKDWFTLHANLEHLQVDETEKVDSFCMPVRSTWSGISRIWKKFNTPEILRNLALFSDPQYSTFKRSKIACKVNQLPPPGAVRIYVMPRCIRLIHFAVSSEHLEVDFRRSEKSARILTSSKIWNFFQILLISLVRAPNGDANRHHFSRQGAV